MSKYHTKHGHCFNFIKPFPITNDVLSELVDVLTDCIDEYTFVDDYESIEDKKDTKKEGRNINILDKDKENVAKCECNRNCDKTKCTCDENEISKINDESIINNDIKFTSEDENGVVISKLPYAIPQRKEHPYTYKPKQPYTVPQWKERPYTYKLDVGEGNVKYKVMFDKLFVTISECEKGSDYVFNTARTFTVAFPEGTVIDSLALHTDANGKQYITINKEQQEKKDICKGLRNKKCKRDFTQAPQWNEVNETKFEMRLCKCVKGLNDDGEHLIIVYGDDCPSDTVSYPRLCVKDTLRAKRDKETGEVVVTVLKDLYYTSVLLNIEIE